MASLCSGGGSDNVVVVGLSWWSWIPQWMMPFWSDSFENKQDQIGFLGTRQLDSTLNASKIPIRELSSHQNSPMISHDTLYTLANSLGVLAMVTAVGYHIVAVNERHLVGGKDNKTKKN